MRIPCPYCGPRDVAEFNYLGDAAPAPIASGDDAVDQAALFVHIYLRDNPAGPHQGYWYHGNGCRSWLVVTRDTISHDISEVRLADSRGRA
ncbi:MULTISPECIES: sarcosine oxidase subunit delta [Rhodopseudomonas]|uniref:Sarcosine oxidase subunit delta n=1 Tax=Rhodopseudomonas palustris TaxID=1076 RepID=A0A0D7F3G1_RHOPL|nr:MULTISPECIES: sarcosine oxidase subunit delta [Rhodopseudomonas]KIZ47648.1 sarcosine oxidase subunit delta [Rhodopseudomonas palustris]MDF3808845.1 sarcosine oxidase subunit delta [Rhodopseudomonas sp. BAL398]WOK19855.1 sarcosine oxidase subunit delta [Rhodopseudomonas sp. BAL398]